MDWSSLPADLLLAVFARLPCDADRARFRAVCAGWGAAAASWRPRPWLVGRGGGGGGLVPFAAAVPAGLEFLSSSSHGYLALSDPMATPKAVALVNPVTGRRIRLPPIGFFKRWHDVATVVLSADPGTADEWAAVAVGFPTNCLAYYSSAAGAWTPLGFSAAGYAGVEHYRGRFYVAFKSQLCVCDVEATVPAVIPLEQLTDDDDGGGGENVDTGRRVVETHLVECDGELLLVSVRDNLERNPEDATIFGDAGDDDDHDGSSSSSDSDGGGDGRVVEVLRVEWVAGGAVRLVRQEDLRSRALFLGRNRAFALSPAEFPACRANCVYLVDQQGHPDGRVRVFDMNADGRWEPEEAAIVARNYALRDETIYPDDGRRDAQSAGWARRGWFFPKY
uniref:KIB1-4 beta-propeller domain-containing protein n=1 Tax=Oryza glumipatula TaxID=40148 RepID=A0A0E0BCS3_9ORYZ